MPTKPLKVWDSCCFIGLFNDEKDKVPGLLAESVIFERGLAILGVCPAVIGEVVTLGDGRSARETMEKFLENPFVIELSTNKEIAFKAQDLQFRFDDRRLPDFKTKALAAGVPANQANRLKSRDAEIIATALFYKAEELTTYDPLLIFLGANTSARKIRY